MVLSSFSLFVDETPDGTIAPTFLASGEVVRNDSQVTLMRSCDPSPVWSPHSKQNINLLESIHRGACWACNSCYDPISHLWTPSSASCCETLHWKSLSFCHDVSSLVIAHDIIHDRSCSYSSTFSANFY